MRWTTGVGYSMALLGLSSCVYGYRTVSLAGRYSTESRPDGSYYCYDCHGYRFFDPYYDYCSYYGFRYQWDDHPRAGGLYRQRYVRIRQAHPEYGRYRYQPGYRGSARYRDPASYDDRRGDSDTGDRDRSGVERREGREGRGEGREGWKERKGAKEGKKDTRERKKERQGGGRRPHWREGA